MSKRQAETPLEELDGRSPLLKKHRTGNDTTTRALPFHEYTIGHRESQASSISTPSSANSEILAKAHEKVKYDEDDESAISTTRRQMAPEEGYDDLYLDTINRSVLDFDFEKLCSVTLSNINVYACLTCGKYFQGRGPKSFAYFHALEEDHHPYINMETKRVYILPEGYEVKSKSLDDIKYVVDPKYTKMEMQTLDMKREPVWDLMGRKYTPGFVGMNNIKANDYFNVVCHALAHVTPLRNFFMLEDLSAKPQLAQRFSILIRKIWNPRAFKSHVSPHELLQEIALRSSKRYTLTAQSDPVDFLSWFLNHLHLALGGLKTKPWTSIVQRVFQGQLKVESQAITARAAPGDRLRFEDADVQTQLSHYLILTLDLPATPLFQDDQDKNIIPQVPLTTILNKYDGVSAQERLNTRVRYRLIHPLPPYLLFHVKRFSVNKFVHERNPTIVTFNPRSLNMTPYVEPNPAIHPSMEPILYDLIANITHEAVRTRDDSVEGEQERKVWRVQLLDRALDEWIEVQDLFVENARAETLFTKESYVQVWERRRLPNRARDKGSGRA
ncbi:cysteine proteinase [Pseudovirgaria hyperparasitica]|uniref:Cysteine proteinase n=1 Tax=Pseudovirgaria hyperparasitica TaxID=470096 RepID=A0A6A6VUZ2_9PEZI|nr:cysteine proteinase [Pseudovirgaria hyperparasitica]KAF2753087.1 cysteine proteinase [Pseudovirgaria hyperparasitica]